VLGPELSVPNIVMELYDATTNTLIKKDTTDANGLYLFTDLVPGTYYLKVSNSTFPTGYKLTKANEPGSAVNSDFDTITFVTPNITLTSGQDDRTWDAGINNKSGAEISDPCTCESQFIYTSQTSVNGQLYSETVKVKGNPGMAWRVIASDPNNPSNVTFGVRQDSPSIGFNPSDNDPVGDLMTEVSPGEYEYTFYHFESTGYNLVVTDGTNILSIGAQCSNVPTTYDQQLDNICFTSGTVNLQTTFPYGNATYYFLQNGAFKFMDMFDENTLIDAAKAGTPITSVNPALYGPNDTISLVVVMTPSSNEKGVCPKDYVVNVTFKATPDCFAAIGDRTWLDANNNNIQDAGDTNLPGVTVTLLDAGGSPVTTNAFGNPITPKVTDSNGNYKFDSLTPGNYIVEFGSVSGLTRVSSNVGSVDSIDSDADATTGKSSMYVLTASEYNKSVDAGYKSTATAALGNYVWFDANGNGRQNSSEYGIENVEVQLLDASTEQLLRTQFTDAQGKYMFYNLEAGTYKVRFNPPAGPNNTTYGITRSNFGTDNLDSDISTSRITGVYTLAIGQVDSTVDAGFTLPDLQPTLTVSPTTFEVTSATNNTIPISAVVRISEVGRAATNGSSIVVRIPKTVFISFTYNSSETMINGQAVNNNLWAFSQNSTHWIFTYTGGVFNSYENSYFGFNGTFNTFNASGQYFMVTTITNGSGGEWNFINNSDSERIDYFTKF
jgi:hypothetical protein